MRASTAMTHIVAGTAASIEAEVEAAAASVRARARDERELAVRMRAVWRLLEEAGLLDAS